MYLIVYNAVQTPETRTALMITIDFKTWESPTVPHRLLEEASQPHLLNSRITGIAFIHISVLMLRVFRRFGQRAVSNSPTKDEFGELRQLITDVHSHLERKILTTKRMALGLGMVNLSLTGLLIAKIERFERLFDELEEALSGFYSS
jgi:hypothetical protein